jgi:hypothetical protein
MDFGSEDPYFVVSEENLISCPQQHQLERARERLLKQRKGIKVGIERPPAVPKKYVYRRINWILHH